MPYFSESIDEPIFRRGAFSESVNPAPLSPALRRALTALEVGDFYTRWEAAKQISACGAEAIDPLLSLLQDDNSEELSWYIARILGTFDHPSAVQGLTHLLQTSQSADVAGMAATALANCGAAAIPTLTHLLHQSQTHLSQTHLSQMHQPQMHQSQMHQSQTRLLAIRALAQIHHPDVIQPLLGMITDPLPSIRATAIDALSRFSDPAIATVLLDALHDSDSSVRRSAVSAMGVQAQTIDSANKEAASHRVQLVAALQPLLWDVNLEVCCQTALTLGRIGNSDAIAHLASVLQSHTTPAQLQQAIIRALGWTETQDAIDCLQQAIFNTVILSDESQLEIITVLGRIKKAEVNQAAIQLLLNLFHAQHPISQTSKGKQTIAHSLGQLAVIQSNSISANRDSNENLSNKVIDALIDLLADSDTVVQFHVVAALKAFDNALVDTKLTMLMRSETISKNLCEGIAIALAELNRLIG